MGKLELQQMVLGPVYTNCYIAKYKETDERKIRNKLIEGKLIRGVNSPWIFEGTEKGIKLQDFYKTLLENWPLFKDDIFIR